MKKGYVHPYHSKKYPLFFTSINDLNARVSEAVGPEQVSPHYETLSRSRRGVIGLFLYIGGLVSIAQLGGWNHNEWIRGLIFHHEFLLAFFVGYSEIRHFFWLPGPKFSVFYDVFSRYEYGQLVSQWNDTIEEDQHDHLKESKEQVEYMRLHKEYRFIKKRALVNYLVNSRLDLEKHFHDRSLTMLNNIKNYETQNLSDQLKDVASSAFSDTLNQLNQNEEETQRRSFESALEGIRKGYCDYASDGIMDLVKENIATRAANLKSLSPEEESKLLALTDNQKTAVANLDKQAKSAYASHVPSVHSPALKSHPKFKSFSDMLAGMK